jgi:hypothetical protein
MDNKDVPMSFVDDARNVNDPCAAVSPGRAGINANNGKASTSISYVEVLAAPEAKLVDRT